ncbi:hypothetical protein GCM10011494_39500 [Novosphingobium endophyticum]|uniref:Uncharacterized protein n=1 Tax=Novosphingobium endophyticum TaxID=1955250 RepID=A0A916TVU9_9SPHN|nr:hypothetical protein GCM10011494_39500 [Novosphingobium endophyticum]
MIAAVTGCSSTYDIHATVIDGTVAFVADTNLLGNPDCVGSISVEADDGPPAIPAPGDDVDAVRRGTYWEETFASPSCENPYPVKYGATLMGPPFVYADGQTKSVKAKPLVRGVTYTVTARSSGSAYGGGKFRLTMNGKVTNLPR